MMLLEHMGKAELAAQGVPVPRGQVADSQGGATAAAVALGGPVVVKAQIPAGGRGKAGGIVRAADPAAAGVAAARLLGQPLLGQPVRAVSGGRMPVHRSGSCSSAWRSSPPVAATSPSSATRAASTSRQSPPARRRACAGSGSTRWPACPRTRRQDWRRACSTPLWCPSCRSVLAGAVGHLPRARRAHRRDQPAGAAGRRASGGGRLPDGGGRRRALPPAAVAALPGSRTTTRANARRARLAFPTSASTATWA